MKAELLWWRQANCHFEAERREIFNLHLSPASAGKISLFGRYTELGVLVPMLRVSNRYTELGVLVPMLRVGTPPERSAFTNALSAPMLWVRHPRRRASGRPYHAERGKEPYSV